MLSFLKKNENKVRLEERTHRDSSLCSRALSRPTVNRQGGMSEEAPPMARDRPPTSCVPGARGPRPRSARLPLLPPQKVVGAFARWHPPPPPRRRRPTKNKTYRPHRKATKRRRQQRHLRRRRRPARHGWQPHSVRRRRLTPPPCRTIAVDDRCRHGGGHSSGDRGPPRLRGSAVGGRQGGGGGRTDDGEDPGDCSPPGGLQFPGSSPSSVQLDAIYGRALIGLATFADAGGFAPRHFGNWPLTAGLSPTPGSQPWAWSWSSPSSSIVAMPRFAAHPPPFQQPPRLPPPPTSLFFFARRPRPRPSHDRSTVLCSRTLFPRRPDPCWPRLIRATFDRNLYVVMWHSLDEIHMSQNWSHDRPWMGRRKYFHERAGAAIVPGTRVGARPHPLPHPPAPP